MIGRLIYVIGPSGAGKDSVLDALREKWNLPFPTHWARRTITRPSGSQGELHEAVDDDTFNALLQAQNFSLHWVANGLRYGIRREELQPLSRGHWVFVNGSRGHLPELVRLWPNATIVYISASLGTLRTRLASRGRESAQAINERIARNLELPPPEGCIHIQNDGTLDDAVSSLMASLGASVLR